ncbi:MULTISPECIES: pyridoxamine 5'-phosphate oxidase family protein [unclassified Streptomyces]|uniref:pyridoxamine 5'-phosphate oxidase family protein n=1 Tax=unclassified Streptomyces TaxID=2593676 RepID=UPI000DC7EF8B|nr:MULTISPECIES: pyridoxamine 5'-phosphate oxidase family protein [unclassified Streptomyces]AWZ03468.1 pyridoxamine 5'-phosphate oxidase family protein [Streptomyces sp. ICC4]AWZ11258.1 pyridoxamine 5'-phosphate oxidase family protein [Streptomyces sp. ICC1]
MDRSEALRLLGTVSLGRIVFTEHALPAVRPVNHLVDGEGIVVRLQGGGEVSSLLATPDAPAVVVTYYEADVIDPETRLGWSVVVTGYASLIGDGNEADGYEALLLPSVSQTMTKAVRIRPDLVTGFRLETEPSHATPVTSP